MHEVPMIGKKRAKINAVCEGRGLEPLCRLSDGVAGDHTMNTSRLVAMIACATGPFIIGCAEKKPEPAPAPKVETAEHPLREDQTEQITQRLMEHLSTAEKITGQKITAAASGVVEVVGVVYDEMKTNKVLDEAAMKSSDLVKQTMAETVQVAEQVTKAAGKVAAEAISEAKVMIEKADAKLKEINASTNVTADTDAAEATFQKAEHTLEQLNPAPTSAAPASAIAQPEAQ